MSYYIVIAEFVYIIDIMFNFTGELSILYTVLQVNGKYGWLDGFISDDTNTFQRIKVVIWPYKHALITKNKKTDLVEKQLST